MARKATQPTPPASIVATLATALMLGACAQDGSTMLDTSLLDMKPAASKTETASAKAAGSAKSELEQATEYWGKKFKEKPADAEAAVSYAKNLKAMGERQQAMMVLQQANTLHPDNKQIASEFGRLALELDQLPLARQMLALADDPVNPDWKVISARGTLLAKEGRYSDAIPLYERAAMLSSEQLSVMNNLAMAYAMAGEAGKAEDVLRRIEAKGGNSRTRQNLALVLGLQGKFDESKAIASEVMGADRAASDAAVLKRMVKAEKAEAPQKANAAAASAKPAIKASVADAASKSSNGADKVAAAEPAAAAGPALKGMSN